MKKLAAAVLICLLATACASQSDLSGPYAHSSVAGGGTRSDATAGDSQPGSTLNDSFHYPTSN
jgi:predicted outer membrane protein